MAAQQRARAAAAVYPGARQERQLVRHKTFSLPRTTVDEAVLDLELCDDEFQLFTEAGSGRTERAD